VKTTLARFAALTLSAVAIAVCAGTGAGAATRVQAWSANLDALAALSPAVGTVAVGSGSTWTVGVPSVSRGTDGAHTVVGTEQLSAAAYYTTLTVPVGTVLHANGWPVEADLCTINGTVHDDGNDASGGTQGAALTINTGVRTAGLAGVAGRSTTGAGAAGTAIGTVWALDGMQPVGGSGGAVTGGAAGAGTAAGTSGGAPGPGYLLSHVTYFHTVGGTERGLRGGGGGGAGGANTGTGTAQSGGSGGGAGRVDLICGVLTGSGTVRTQGGDGGNASTTGNGAAGGGGGGTGGWTLVYAVDATGWEGTISAPGGAAGTSIGATAAATEGGAGLARLWAERQ
jgi:hypothetical protein